jgi:hypothetical protein
LENQYERYSCYKTGTAQDNEAGPSCSSAKKRSLSDEINESVAKKSKINPTQPEIVSTENTVSEFLGLY